MANWTKCKGSRTGWKRVPLSGLPRGGAGDLMIGGRRFEVKTWGKGFRRLYRGLEDRFGLVLSANQKEPVVVMRLGDFLRSCRFREGVETVVSKTPERDSGTGSGLDLGNASNGREK